MTPLFGIGPLGVTELIIILVIVLVIFGVGRLPEIGSAMGKAIRGFRKETSSEEAPAKKKTKKAE